MTSIYQDNYKFLRLEEKGEKQSWLNELIPSKKEKEMAT